MSNQLQVSGEAKIRAIQGPVVANSGVITALDGDASEYVRGDGTLADFPTSTGGGSSVSYYLNTSVSQGTIGGVAYKQLSKVPISGAGTDVTTSANGYIASYITDANDPALLEVPAGNFNCEFYFSVNSNAHNPYVYAEVYKYDGTTFTLLGSNVSIPQYLSNGTTLSPYYFAIAVSTAVLTVTDRIAIRIYVNVDTKTVTLHTENNHLCQVVTTFSKGLISLNNLTRQNQFFGTGTSGTDFNISSTTATHTFNIPSASATNRGLITTGSQTIAGIKSFNNAIKGEEGILLKNGVISSSTGYTALNGFDDTLIITSLISGTSYSNYLEFTPSTTNTYTFPNLSGTLALLEGTQTFTGLKTFGDSIQAGYGISLYNGIGTGALVSATYTGFYAAKSGTYTNITFAHDGAPYFSRLKLLNNATYDYTFPASSGTLALTSDLSSYVPYTGATSGVDLGIYNLSSNALIVNGTVAAGGSLNLKQNATTVATGIGYNSIGAKTANSLQIYYGGATSLDNKTILFNVTNLTNTSTRTFEFPDASGTIALTSGTQTFTGATTFSSDLLVSGLTIGRGGSAVVGNTAIGAGTLAANTTGVFNTAIGYYALASNTIGVSNTAIGANSLLVNTTGNNNTSIGTDSLNVNTTGSRNTAIGYYALNANTTANNNAAIGYYTLVNNTTGAENLGVGNEALRFNTLGNNNVAIGNESLRLNTTGTSNTSIGVGALYSNTTGGNNIAIGYNSATSITTGSNNTIIGGYVGTAAMANNIVLADGAGTIRYQWNGTNNAFTGAATFSSSLQVNNYQIINGVAGGTSTYLQFNNNGTAIGYVGSSAAINSGTSTSVTLGVASGAGLTIASTGAATFSSSVNMGGDLALTPNDSAITFSSGAGRFFTGGTERMRITSGGFVKMSNTGTYLYSANNVYETISNTSGDYIKVFANTSSTPYGIRINYPNVSPNNTSREFWICDDNIASRAYLRSNGGLSNYQTYDTNLSDERTKKDIIPLESYWDKFKAIEIVKFKYKDQTHDDYNIGVIAQQLESVAPEFVDTDGWGSKDAENEEPLLSVYTADLYHATIKVLQEAMTKIEELQSRLDKAGL